MNRSAKRLLIVSTNLNGFSLANHGQFIKFAKLSRYIVQCQLAGFSWIKVHIEVKNAGHHIGANPYC